MSKYTGIDIDKGTKEVVALNERNIVRFHMNGEVKITENLISYDKLRKKMTLR